MGETERTLETLVERLDHKGRLNKRLRLLEAINTSASLTLAAEQLGVCYKTAWNHVRELSQAAECPLVETSTGGASGGGSTLTAEGAQLLALMRIRRTEAQHALQTQRPALRFSARNQLACTLTRMDVRGVIADVEMQIGQVHLRSRITTSSIERLGLVPGGEVYAILKASTLKLQPVTNAKHERTEDNRLTALIRRCDSSANGRELELELAPGIRLTAVRPFVLAEERWLYPGAEIQVVIDPHEIMLATAM